MYFNINFNVFFKLIKVHLLVSELYIIRLYLIICSIINVLVSPFKCSHILTDYTTYLIIRISTSSCVFVILNSYLRTWV